ncbi:MAG: amidase [Thermoanaerobaculia bacterium]
MGRKLDRRSLFRYGAVGGALAALLPALERGEGAATAEETPSALAFELEETTFGDLQKRMETGADTARTIAEKYLARIDALDRSGPSLHSVLEINPDALQIAGGLDAERARGSLRGALHGIPILLKDNVATADRMSSAAGSLALEGFRAPKDSFVARRLREAGAVILGKTNLSEWANFRSTHSSSGWSGRGGQCLNPYALDRTPSGSSSGSGAAVAANFAAAAIGTETDGSIVSPSNNNALVGVKPTVGLLSRVGIVPISHTQDTAGPMTRSVRDAAILLSALAGLDPEDAATAMNPAKAAVDYAAHLDENGLKGARIGVPRKSLFGYSPAADRLAEAAIGVLRKLGATVVDPADIATVDDFGKTELEVLLYEFKADLNSYLAALGPGAPVRSLKEVIEFNERHRDREMPFFGQEILEMAEKKGPLTDRAYRKALENDTRGARGKGIDAVMEKHRLDALVAPTGAPASLIDLVNGDYGSGGSSTVPAIAGYPHVTVPMGFAYGLPVGLSFFGRPWSEAALFKFAYAYEQATRHRKPPKFLKTAELTVRL